MPPQTARIFVTFFIFAFSSTKYVSKIPAMSFLFAYNSGISAGEGLLNEILVFLFSLSFLPRRKRSPKTIYKFVETFFNLATFEEVEVGQSQPKFGMLSFGNVLY